MKSIGIKLADGSFYPILEEGSFETKDLEVTTVKDNQTKVQIDLYRSETNSMEDAEYVDSLEITHLKPHPNGEPTFNLELNLDFDNKLHAKMKDPETGKSSEFKVDLVMRTEEERQAPANFALNDSDAGIMPGVEAVSSILGSPNDEEFSFDPTPDLDKSTSDFDDEDTTIDLSSLDIDSIEEAPVSDEFMTDSQVIDDDIVSDKPLTDADMLSPDDLFVDDADNKFVDNDGTGFSFVDDSESTTEPAPVEEPKAETPTIDENDFQIPTSLLDSSLFDETRNDSPAQKKKVEEEPVENIDTDIEPPDFSDLELNDIGEMDETFGDSIIAEPAEETFDENFGIEPTDLPSENQDESLEESFDEIPEEKIEENASENIAEPEDENPYDLPTFEELVTDSPEKAEPEKNEEPVAEPTVDSGKDFSLPSFEELDTSTVDDFDNDSLGDFTIPTETEEEKIPEPDTETVEKNLTLPDFDANDSTDSTEIPVPDFTVDEKTESDDLALPDFDSDGNANTDDLALPDFDSDGNANTDDLALPDFDSDGNANTDDLALPDFDNTATESTEKATSETSSDFSVDSLDLPDFGDVDLTSTEEPKPEEKPSDDFSLDLPDFGEDGTADTDSFATSKSTENDFGLPPLIDSSDTKSFESEEKLNTSFDIDDLDMPDFDNLDATSEPAAQTSSVPSDFPDFGDPFDSISSATADTDFDFPDFDDSPTKMENSETKEIFGDFDDTDAVFEGETDGFVDPTAGKKKKVKKAKKAAKTNDYEEEEEKDNSKKPIIFLLAALAMCLVVIFILVFQSRGHNTGKKSGQEIATTDVGTETKKETKITKETKSTKETSEREYVEIVTSMGTPRSSSTMEDVEQDSEIENTEESSETSVEPAVTETVNPPETKTEDAETTEKTEKAVTETKTEEETVRRPKVFETAKKVEPQAQVVIPAQEDTIVVASNPETVVPVKKSPSSTSTSDIKYTVVWGDTLWDISTAYYKTPYRYNSIAEHNGISDANKIKSGQVLLIPAE